MKYKRAALQCMQKYFASLENDYRKAIEDEKAKNHDGRVSHLEDLLLKNLPKHRAEQIKLLDKASNTGTLRQIDLQLRWRNNYEGYQCKAEATVTFDDPEYGTSAKHYASKYTSGGGYDKASTAIQNALESDPSLIRAIVEAGPKMWDLQYGIDTRGIPSLSISGKGIETFHSLFFSYNKEPILKGKWVWIHDDLGKAEVIHIKRIR